MNKHVLLSLVIATTFLLGTPNDIFAGKNGRLTFKCPKPAHWKLPDGNCIKKGEKRKEGIRRYKNMLGVSNQPKSTQEELLARPPKCTPVYKEVDFKHIKKNNSKVLVCEETGRPVPTD
jgi:hypothetical protein